MTGRDLLRLIGEIDDSYLELSLDEVKKSEKRRRATVCAVVASCATVLVGAAVGLHVWNLPSLTDAPAEETVIVESPPFQSPRDNAKSGFRGSYAWHEITVVEYAELANRADLVVCVDVISVAKNRRSHGIYSPYATVVVREVLTGTGISVGDTIAIRDNGVILHDNSGQTECGGPLMEPGNRLILFLKLPSAQQIEEYGSVFYEMSDATVSKFFLDNDGLYYPSAVYSDQFGTNYLTSPMLADYSPKSLEDMRMLINSRENGL